MALFNWIKKEYYDYRLRNADQLVRAKSFEKATQIYQSLFGKHPLAIVNYSRMLVDKSTSYSLMLKNLKEIEELNPLAELIQSIFNSSNGLIIDKIHIL